jgi:hypothetical protein
MIMKGEVKKFINKAYDDNKKASTSISSSTPATPSSQKPRWWQKCDASTPTVENVPMDIDKMMKKTTQRLATRKKKMCFRCGGEGHMSYDCPSPDSRERMARIVEVDDDEEEEKGKGKKKANMKKSDAADDKPTPKPKIDVMKMSKEERRELINAIFKKDF